MITAFGLYADDFGALVLATEPGGTADQAGILPGDVISVVRGMPIYDPVELDSVVWYWIQQGVTDFAWDIYRGGDYIITDWAITEDLCTGNPAKGLRLPHSRSAKERRKAFSSDQLRRIFIAPIYCGCVDDERHYAVAGDQRPRRSRFWVPLFSLFGGLRLNKACQLLVEDIREDRGVLCFHISAEGGGKAFKTAASNRVVPVHWFARFLVTCGAAELRTCFHSFRRSAIHSASSSRSAWAE